MSTKELHQLSLAEMVASLRAREVSAVELAGHFLARMDQHAGLGAFLSTDSEVTLAQARAADDRLARGPGPA